MIVTVNVYSDISLSMCCSFTIGLLRNLVLEIPVCRFFAGFHFDSFLILEWPDFHQIKL